MKIREAAARDEEAVVALWAACELVAPHNNPGEDFRFAVNGPASTVLICEMDHVLVGTILVGHDGHRGWLYYVATDPSRRRRGIGRTLIAAAETWLRVRGVPKLHLMIRETNPQAVGFYVKLGFEPMPRFNMQKWLKG